MPSLEQLLATIESIYDAGMDEAQWPLALESLSDLLGGTGTTVALRDGAGCFPVYHFTRYSPELHRTYPEYYHRVDPNLAFVARAPLGVYTDRMVMPKAELRRSEIYNDFGLPNDMASVIHAFAFRTADCACLVVAGRSLRAGDFEEEHVETLNLLLPHLGRAMRLHLRLGAARTRADSAIEVLERLTLGVLLVDQRARVILANRAAEAALARADGIGVDASGLRAATPSQTSALRQLIARAADRTRIAGRGGALRLDRPSMRRPLSVLVAPLGTTGAAWLPELMPAAIVFVSDPEQDAPRPAPHLRALYGLTSAEAAAAEAIAQGQGVKDAAEALGVASTTVRWHLQRVFEKTGTTRQAELARLVERLGIVAGNGRGLPR